MNVLITGSSGFIGNNIYHYFKKKRIKLIGIDKKKNKYNNIKNFLKIDLSNYEKLEKALNKLQKWMKDGKKLDKKYGKKALDQQARKSPVRGRGKNWRRTQDTVQKAQGKGSGQGTKAYKEEQQILRNKEKLTELKKGNEKLKRIIKSLGRKVPEGM